MRRKGPRRISRLVFFRGRRSSFSVVTCCVVLLFSLIPFSLSSVSWGGELENVDPPVKENKNPNESDLLTPENKTPIDVSGYSKQIQNLEKRNTSIRSIISSFGALALILCVFLGLVYVTKVVMPKRCRRLSHSLEIIDSCFIDSKNELTTIRWGEKLILVARSQGRWTPLSELSNGEDVKRFLESNASEDKEDDSLHFKRLFKPLIPLNAKDIVSGE